jgi:hypothetical protein
MSEAAVEDANEAIGEAAKSLAVRLSLDSLPVVVSACPG